MFVQHRLRDAVILSWDAKHTNHSFSWLLLMLLSKLFIEQTFIKYLPWTGLVLSNVGGTTPTATLFIHLSTQALEVH